MCSKLALLNLGHSPLQCLFAKKFRKVTQILSRWLLFILRPQEMWEIREVCIYFFFLSAGLPLSNDTAVSQAFPIGE